MAYQFLLVMIALASLVIGALFCWLALRGRIAAAAAQGDSKTQAALALAEQRIHSLKDERKAAAVSHEALKLQAAQAHEALDLARTEQAPLAEQAARVPALEEELFALHYQENANQQELHRLSASDTKSIESLRQVSARLAALEDENATLKREIATMAASVQAPDQPPATPEVQATQLPVLEVEVLALQTMAKTIQQEFQLLAELQRSFTLTSTELQAQMSTLLGEDTFATS